MDRENLVSCIITTYRREPKMVLRSVQSVLNQTYQYIEIIVVDDSPDTYEYRNSVENSIKHLNKNIKYIKNEKNLGACAARNIGIIHSNGAYIAFLDDDDEWLPNKIEKQIKKFDNETGLVYCRANICYESGEIKEQKRELYSGDLYYKLLYKNIIGSTSFAIIKRTVIDEAGLFDINMQSSQDMDLWIRIAKVSKCSYVDEPLVNYYIHGSECITANPMKKIAGLERLNQKYWDEIIKDKRILWRRLIVLWPYYLQTKQYKKAFKIYIKALIANPFYIKENIECLFKGLQVISGEKN